MSFSDLYLLPALLRAVEDLGYEEPTPIQIQAIPPLLDGQDLLGCAQTGTGKTAAFALPILQRLEERPLPSGERPIRALILSPTRELAAQIDESFHAYGRYLDFRHAVIFGGVSQVPQERALRRGIDVLTATPGRLLDLLSQGLIDLSRVEYFVLDEADRMLDMGFIHDVKRVLRELPPRTQNLLFSATLPASIAELGSSFLRHPVSVEVSPEAPTVEAIDQLLMYVERPDKRRLLAHLLDRDRVDRAIVFTRTKHGANRLVKQLDRVGVRAAAIHGNKSQGARQRALQAFKDGAIDVLVATDLAARGLDVDDVTHVFNYDLPNEPQVYVHRIGRTGRAGRSGIAIAFCDTTEAELLRDIERLTGLILPVDTDHPWHSDGAMEMRGELDRSRGRRSRGQQRGGGSNRSGGRGRRDRQGREEATRSERRETKRPTRTDPAEAVLRPPRRKRRRPRRRGAPGTPRSEG